MGLLLILFLFLLFWPNLMKYILALSCSYQELVFLYSNNFFIYFFFINYYFKAFIKKNETKKNEKKTKKNLFENCFSFRPRRIHIRWCPGRTQEDDSNCTTTQFAVFFNKNNMYFLLFLCDWLCQMKFAVSQK